jgi:type IV pilus assembly protein PilM
MGARTTDLIVVYGGAPRLIRSIAVGGETLIKSAMQNLNTDYKQAAQFVSKFGLAQDKLEGQVFKALKSSMESLIEEIKKSVKFFSSRYQQISIEKIVVSGGASRLPEFPLYVANNTGMPVEIGNAWTNANYSSTLHDTLLSISSQFSVATGLALRSEAKQ